MLLIPLCSSNEKADGETKYIENLVYNISILNKYNINNNNKTNTIVMVMIIIIAIVTYLYCLSDK